MILVIRKVFSRLQKVKLHNHFIPGKIITKDHPGKVTFIPLIDLDTGESNTIRLPFILHGRQISVVITFAITINKSLGQRSDRVEKCMDIPLFSQGQLYVASSKCRSKSGINI